MSAWAKQQQTEPARSIGKPHVAKAGGARRTKAVRQPVSYTTSDYDTPVDWRDEQQVQAKVSEWAAGDQEELQLTDYIESRGVKWIKELEEIADIARSPQGDRRPGLRPRRQDPPLADQAVLGQPAARGPDGADRDDYRSGSQRPIRR